jgi:hypothetical protein
LMSHSKWKICCQVPSTGFRSATGTVNKVVQADRTSEAEAPSP